MNVLCNDFPEAINVDGQIIEIDYDYRNCIQIILAWEDEGLTDEEKAFVTIDRLYEIENSEIKNIEVAFEKACLFLNNGDESEEKSKPKKRVYSFEKDNKYIYSAIDKTLDGRLSDNKNVHWWLFSMAFMEISEDTMLSKIIYLRTQKNKNKLTKEERETWAGMKEILELDVPIANEMSDEESANYKSFMDKLGIKEV